MFSISKEKIRGSGVVILNVIRALNVIALLSVAVASWIMIVMSGLTGKFNFFDTMAQFFAFLVTTFLIVSECGVFQHYFTDVWPVLADDHGFFWLAVALVMLGCNTMANLAKPVYFADNISWPLWRVIMAAGILSITAGCFNLIATFFFQDRNEKITARMVRRNGSLAKREENSADYYTSSNYSVHKEKEDESKAAKWAKRATKRATHLFRNKRPEISRPIPHQSDDVERGHHSDVDSWRDDIVTSPVDNKTPRPPSAAHPLYAKDVRYSVSTNISRF